MIFRVLVTSVVAIAAFYLTLWLVGALLLPQNTPIWIRLILSLAVAIAAGRQIWKRPGLGAPGLGSAILTGGLVVGGVGFCGGFFGPLVFAPQANQGPLLGILITGPLGFVAGAVGGGVYWWLRRKRASAPRA